MKKKRHKKIVELINRYEIETQEELADMLRKEGFEVTQATVSRDIRELKLSKVASAKGRQKYAVVGTDSALGDKYIRVLAEGMIGMDVASSLLVVKTVSGMAMAVAAALDAMNMQEIVGTIAGDDTIMLAIRTPEDTAVVMEKVNELI